MADSERDDLSDDEDILLFLLLIRRRRRRLRAANRQLWTKRWILRRQRQGVYDNLIQELNAEDPEKFGPDIYQFILQNCFGDQFTTRFTSMFTIRHVILGNNTHAHFFAANSCELGFCRTLGIFVTNDRKYF